MAAIKTNQASHASHITQMLLFQLFQSQIQNQHCKIDLTGKETKMMGNLIEDQTKKMGEMMNKILKQMKERKRRKKKPSKIPEKKKEWKMDDVWQGAQQEQKETELDRSESTNRGSSDSSLSSLSSGGSDTE
jgi:hypothetical protein